MCVCVGVCVCACVRTCVHACVCGVSKINNAYSTDGISQPEGGPSQTVEGLFGDAADLSSS